MIVLHLQVLCFPPPPDAFTRVHAQDDETTAKPANNDDTG